MLDVTEMAALLGTSMRTVYIWHRQGRLKPHRYNDSGAYLYEYPKPTLRFAANTENPQTNLYTQPTTRCSMKRSPCASS
jgi:predicted site-specific integrase-resolvase